MKFGLSFLPDANGEDLSAAEYYKTALELAKIADEAGLSTIKITEHYLHPYGGFCPDPITFLAAVAAATKQIRLMTGCILPVFHHPVQIAAKTAMLDVISNGRLDVGFARAYLPHEFNAFQVSMDGSRDKYEKTIEAVIKLWTEESVSMTTEYFKFENASNFPKTIQSPHPPVWGAAVMSRQSFSWLGEQRFNLLVTPPLNGLAYLRDKTDIYLNSYSFTQNQKKPKITLSMPLLMTENTQEAIQLSDKHLKKYNEVWANATETWSHHASVDYPGYRGLGHILQANTPERMRKHLQVLVGTPSQIIENIHQISEMVNLDQIIWQIDFGAQPASISKKTLELFIEKVLPHVNHYIKEENYAA